MSEDYLVTDGYTIYMPVGFRFKYDRDYVGQRLLIEVAQHNGEGCRCKNCVFEPDCWKGHNDFRGACHHHGETLYFKEVK